ncbi:MAG: DNA repair protein RecO [Planctomycetota bacterium]|nr:MAG: DNA repair protein RecO [Planctomycetota bacterium]
MRIKDAAICLRTVNYSETSQVVTLFTRENGKVAAMAKGSRRIKSSFDGPIEVFSFGEVMFITKDFGGQLAMLTEFSQQPRFRGFQRNLYMLNAALFAAELTERFLEDHDPHPELFDKFQKFLETLQQTNAESEILAWLILYQLRLLEETGLAPMLDACVNCGQTRVGTAHPTYFSSSHNGLLCADCEMAFPEKRLIDTSMLNILQNPAKLPKTEMKDLNKIESLLIYHFTELLHKPPKMAKYFG